MEFPVEKIRLRRMIPYVILSAIIASGLILFQMIFTVGGYNLQIFDYVIPIVFSVIINFWIGKQAKAENINFSQIYSPQKKKFPIHSLALFLIFKMSLVLSVGMAFTLPILLGTNGIQNFKTNVLSVVNPISICTIISLVIIVPIAEEKLFRLVLLNKLKSKIGLRWAIIVSSVIFGLTHCAGGIDKILITTFVGIFYAIIYVYTGSIKISTIMHAINNAIVILIEFIPPGDPNSVEEIFLPNTLATNVLYSITYVMMIVSATYVLHFFIKYTRKIAQNNPKQMAD